MKSYIINACPRKFVYLKKVHRLLIFHDKFLHFLVFPINIELKNIENQIFSLSFNGTNILKIVKT